MSDDPIILPTRPLNPGESRLREKYFDSLADQSNLMDALGRQLITLELAIPGLYATVLKLTQGDKATLAPTPWLIATFGCWFIALALTIVSLIPRDWKVDPTLLKSDPTGKSPVLSIKEFFYQSARYKRRLLLPACFLFWVGILGAAWLVFIPPTP